MLISLIWPITPVFSEMSTSVPLIKRPRRPMHHRSATVPRRSRNASLCLVCRLFSNFFNLQVYFLSEVSSTSVVPQISKPSLLPAVAAQKCYERALHCLGAYTPQSGVRAEPPGPKGGKTNVPVLV